ncbi:MAG TPA: ABC transporter permease [Reyranella sp.]|nr:ABC transporter permease [Reyranella sp.]
MIGSYLLRRAFGFAFVLLGLSVVIFVVARIVPGDPARIALGPLATPEQVAQLREEMGFSKPAVVQYLDYIGGVLSGNLGKSLLTNRAVSSDIAQALPATLELVLFTLLLIGVLAVPLGVVAARWHNSWIDNGSRLVSLLGVVTPGFVVAILLQLFASHYHFFPLTGRLSQSLGFVPDITGLALVDSLLKGRLDAFTDALSHIFLPALALSAAGIGQIMRITRSSMLDIARRDHVETLRSFGVPGIVITLKYMLRLASIAPLTIFGLEFASLIGNAFIVEMVFAWPGIASYGLRAILSKDFNAVMAVVLVSGLFFAVANLLVDLAVGLIDPRLRARAGGSR